MTKFPLKTLTAKSIVLKTNPVALEQYSINLRENIKKILIDYEITKAEFARLVDLSYSYVHTHLLNEEKPANPTLEVITKISIIFNISPNELVGFTSIDE